MPNLNVAPSLDLTAFFNLFNCTFVHLQFTLLYSTIIYLFISYENYLIYFSSSFVKF